MTAPLDLTRLDSSKLDDAEKVELYELLPPGLDLSGQTAGGHGSEASTEQEEARRAHE